MNYEDIKPLLNVSEKFNQLYKIYYEFQIIALNSDPEKIKSLGNVACDRLDVIISDFDKLISSL